MNGIDGDSSRRLRRRARLLEFLKFRVLAAQESFFDAWCADTSASSITTPPSPPALLAGLDLVAFRLWLQQHWSEAAGLSDADLRHCLEQAHRLYVDPPPRRRT